MTDQSPAPDAAHFAVWADFVLAYTRVMRTVEKALKSELAISWAQYDLLYNLGTAPAHTLSVSAVSRTLLYSSGSASNLVSSMVKAGLVERRPSPDDRRSILITPTEHGETTFTLSTRLVLEVVQREFAVHLGESELGPVGAFLARLRAQDAQLRHPPYDLPVELG
ncbi:hypothetical protein B7R54_16735 [Subtercola boreus]|uniref:HTH marR-type domain-containing protein n=1 Tax=Subtercola boreus TaxID=120213 RepID=A0A3E0VPA1_9MICO|nr:MarR family transcriptional regulator [Subtercola boreus]RFA10667.1 hypothetical protein B7R54_16735 [Subtercola boreus]TQL55773.1 DNA-binding MarR family transcriptional regulator [Subtercola boreus]